MNTNYSLKCKIKQTEKYFATSQVSVIQRVHIKAERSAVQYSAVQYSEAQYSTEQYSAVLYSAVQYSTNEKNATHSSHYETAAEMPGKGRVH